MIQPHNVSASGPVHDGPVSGSPATGSPASESPVPGSPASGIPASVSPETVRPEVQWPDSATLTGDPLVDKALNRLGSVPAAPVADHGDLYAAIHDSLLEALDSEPGLPAAPINTPRLESDS